MGWMGEVVEWTPLPFPHNYGVFIELPEDILFYALLILWRKKGCCSLDYNLGITK